MASFAALNAAGQLTSQGVYDTRQLFSFLDESLNYIEKYARDSFTEAECKLLTDSYLDLLHVKARGEALKQSIEQTCDKARGDTGIRVAEALAACSTENEVLYEELQENENYVNFKHRAERILNDNENTNTEDSDPETSEGSDEEGVVKEKRLVMKDPISMKPIQDPVRNKHCRHVYERGTILQIINARTGNKLCPFVGCGNKRPITAQDLESDLELAAKLKKSSKK